LLVAAPITAEYLQAYLPSTGHLLALLTGLLILAPLYGGAALLIREVAVRWGLGWTGILLLAAAFGLAMPGLVDLALFAEQRADIPYWNDMRQATLIGPLGISAHPTISWVCGHVLMSVGAPLALLDALAPRHRRRPLLGRPGIVVVSVLWVAAALLVRSDAVQMYGYRPSLAQSLAVLAAVVLLAVLAFTPLGRPVRSRGDRSVRPAVLVLAGALGMFGIDVLPWTWAGVATIVVLLVGAATLLRRCAATRRWSAYEIGALAAGAVVGRCLIGFLAPVPDGVSIAAKLAQNAVLLAATLTLAWLVTARVEPEQTPAAP
jgi:hypothetical protein